jgi:branched-chain amino acid transport system ATP-binding protein
MSVAEGEIVCVLGPNGAGKSTLLKAISGLIKPFAGSIEFGGHAIAGVDPARIAGQGLAQVPENRRLFAEHSLETNLRIGGWVLGGSRKAIKHRVDEVLERFPELISRRSVAAGVLSGGQQQMLAVAMALMAKPRLMTLDEPSLGLAPRVAQRVYSELALLRSEGTSMLIVEQSVDRVLSIADRGYILKLGRLAGEGTAAELRHDPMLRAAYLGRS